MSNTEKSTSSSSPLSFPSGPSEREEIIVENPATENSGESSARRPRGRPLGSKNRPKGNVLNNTFRTQTIKKIVIQIPPGVDIIHWLAGYAQSKGESLTVLSGFGCVSEVTLHHMGSPLPPKIFTEDLNLLSFSGACIISPSGRSTNTNFFNASLVRKNGCVVGGSALRIVTLCTMMLSVSTFTDPMMYKIEPLA